jgi:tripartite-type tricarboxylate transporter receptor subunit TctC
MSFDSLSVLIPLMREGKARGLGVTTRVRNPLLPDLPAIAEALPGYEVTVFNFIAVRSGTPQPVIDRLSREIAACMQEPRIRERNDSLGTESLGTTPEELATVLREESIKWRGVIERAGIRLE